MDRSGAISQVMDMQMIQFMWKNILTWFDAPKVLIRENETQFEGSPFKEWCEEKRIHHCFISVTHP